MIVMTLRVGSPQSWIYSESTCMVHTILPSDICIYACLVRFYLCEEKEREVGLFLQLELMESCSLLLSDAHVFIMICSVCMKY